MKRKEQRRSGLPTKKPQYASRITAQQDEEPGRLGAQHAFRPHTHGRVSPHNRMCFRLAMTLKSILPPASQQTGKTARAG